jgi:hypothetical protein
MVIGYWQFLEGETLNHLINSRPIDRADLGMVECRRGAGLTLNTFQSLRVTREIGRRNFSATWRPS